MDRANQDHGAEVQTAGIQQGNKKRLEDWKISVPQVGISLAGISWHDRAEDEHMY